MKEYTNILKYSSINTILMSFYLYKLFIGIQYLS